MTLAFPKPQREDRPKRGEGMDTHDLALPKAHFLRDGDYKAWIRSQRCLLPKYDGGCKAIGERRDTEAAHLEHGGKGVKGSDASCIPLCPTHHDQLDSEVLPWQVVASLWKSAWRLREEWNRKGSK